ncbi:MAG: biosynthetic-type acetolactate synthase large subunit [Clostridiales bacterium]|nr:biosynthetic-type acetolactate synthase large subunit [Clostridiales bacterium]
MKLNGGNIVCEVLLEHGVDTVFGYPGGAALNLYDALYGYQGKIRHVLTAHEQGASHAADGYARASGKTGVVFATSGPGATNLVTGIAAAFMDSVPMVAITSNVASSLIGRDAFQEIYITGVTLPITKHNFFVNRADGLAHALRESFRIANTGRKGPVLIDITKNATAESCEFEPMAPYTVAELPKAADWEVQEVADLINKSERPAIYFGGGATASGAGGGLVALAEKADIPAAHTIMAAGVIGSENKRNLGLIGMHGTVAANMAIDNADLVIALGTRFSDRVALNMEKFAKRAKLVQVDIDRSEINKNVSVDVSVISDVKYFLEKLLPLVEERRRPERLAAIDSWKEKYRVEKDADSDSAGVIKPHQLIGRICDMTDKETIYVTDVGQHQMWAAQYIKHKNTNSFLTSAGLGAMGYGYGASIGAQMAFPGKRVVHITGDGSFHMNMSEACTAVSNRLPIISVIFNNRVLGMVYQWQNAFYGGRLSATVPERVTDFAKIAEGFGARGFRANTLGEFESAFAAALKENGPSWIECSIDREEKVLPMIPNGATVEDIILE